MKRIKAISVGGGVQRLLARGGSARVIGSTSKGIFSISADKEVIFLSYEGCRSPLTLNLGNSDEDLRQVEIGEEIVLSEGGLRFAAGRFEVDCAGVPAWSAPEPAGKASGRDRIAERIRALAAGIIAEKPEIGFAPLVAALILRRGQAEPLTEDPAVGKRIENILRVNRPRDLAAVLKEMEGVLGFGRGLTPSGDDLALGFLLAINRWGDDLGYERDKAGSFDHDLIQLAERKTTSLSAAMIRLAASGEGDERQLAVVDGLMCGEPAIEVCLKNVLEMGNSSGIDSFLGMAAGIL